MTTRTQATSASPNTNTRLLIIPITGTASINQNSNTLTGVGTAFLNEVRSGDFLTISGEELQVDAVTSNTVLTFRTTLVQANITGASITLFPTDGFRFGGDFPVFIRNRSTNTDVIYFGVTQNATRNGTDVTITTKSYGLAVGEVSPPLFSRDLRNCFVQSPTASQRYDVLIN